MVFIKWNKSLSVKVKRLDNQHKKLINILNKTYELAKLKKDGKRLDNLLSELVEFSRVHFSTEEKYFVKCKYKGTRKHIIEHEKLTRRTLKFYDKFHAGKADILIDFLKFLKGWFKDHLKTMDQKYVKCFQECGLK